MFNANTIPRISIAMMVLGSIFSVIALSTEYWGKLDPASKAFSNDVWSGNWGMFSVCLKLVSGQNVQSECKSLDSYPQYWNATFAFEILALVCSLIPIPVWCIWVCFPKPTAFPWLRIMKIVTITFVCLTAFFHAVAVSVWHAKDEGPKEVKQFAVTQGFSWGFTIFCIIWEILIMLPMQMSLPRYKRGKVVKQPTHPLFRPDPEGGGIVIPQDMVESEDNTQPGFLSKPNIFPTASRTFLDSLPDERNVYVYDEEEGAIKPKTISRNTGSRVAEMMGNTWGKQPAAKSKLQMLKETWGKRSTFKFGFGTRSKATGAEQNGTVSQITGEPTQSNPSRESKADNSVPLFVKSLWNTHFKKDEIRDNYEIESDNRVTKRWETETSKEVVDPNFSWKNESSERKDYNHDDDDYGEVEEIDDNDVASDEEDENEGKVYNIPSSSEDEGDAERVVTVPNPNIVYEKKTVERKNYNIPGYEEETEIPDYEHESVPSRESNFSFEKKVIERRNYNDVSSAEEEGEDTDEDDTVTNTKRQAPGIPITQESHHTQRIHRRMSDDHSSVSDEMYTYSYEEGLDTCGKPHSPRTPRTPGTPRTPTDDVMINPLQFMPSVKLEVDMNNVPNMPNESSDGADDNSWARPYDENSSNKKGKRDYDNFAYLHDMTDNEHNVTEI